MATGKLAKLSTFSVVDSARSHTCLSVSEAALRETVIVMVEPEAITGLLTAMAFRKPVESSSPVPAVDWGEVETRRRRASDAPRWELEDALGI